ncbi:CLUMA_CG011391, isoform A [Clunio marinus]|uniref:CLUMA_CG011391, isoform A n=1 Tax=Clunio marinus TaxID=568069 RepID=A0A1J1IG54_9DIPT|nr:CLUMA_CG011391, isoform A [Clunio marinus]
MLTLHKIEIEFCYWSQLSISLNSLKQINDFNDSLKASSILKLCENNTKLNNSKLIPFCGSRLLGFYYVN